MAGKKNKFGTKGRKKKVKGVKVLTEGMGGTLGPKRKKEGIEKNFCGPKKKKRGGVVG